MERKTPSPNAEGKALGGACLSLAELTFRKVQSFAYCYTVSQQHAELGVLDSRMFSHFTHTHTLHTPTNHSFSCFTMLSRGSEFPPV